jgi:hypothetical protein
VISISPFGDSNVIYLNIKFCCTPEPYIKRMMSNFTIIMRFQIFHSRTKDPIIGFRPQDVKIISCAEAFNCFAIDFLKVLEHFSHFVKLWVEEGFRNLCHHFSHFLRTSVLWLSMRYRGISFHCKVMKYQLCILNINCQFFLAIFVKIYFERVLSLLVFVYWH